MHLDNCSRKLRPQLVIPRGSERWIQGNRKVPNSNICDTNGHFSPLEYLFSFLNRFRIKYKNISVSCQWYRRGFLEVNTVIDNQLFIDGTFRTSAQSGILEVINPATEEPCAKVACASSEDVEEAVAAAKHAQPGWAKLPAIERGRALHALAQSFRQHAEELARILTCEQGKVLPLARSEVAAAAEYLDFTAEWARRIEGEILQSDRPRENILMFVMPLGVVAGILPWNYPLFLLVRKLAPALLTGNTIVIKPSEETPVNACEVGKLVQQVGLPDGVVNILPGGRDVGEALCRHPDVRLISLTGSVATGMRIMAAAASHMARVSLELGGKAPCIVMEDADIALAARCIRDSRIHNAGQVCNCAERVYVHRKRLDEFCTRLTEAMQQVRFGDPLDESMDYGPLINGTRREAVARLLEEGRHRGAHILPRGFSWEGFESIRGGNEKRRR